MQIGWNFIWFIIGVSLLVTVHEFGHFWVARKLGFKVLRFSVGFGKPLYKKIGAAPDHTEYVIAALPLGGYVRMLDEREGNVSAADMPRSFTSKPPWQRILVMLAGPAANILFAIAVLWAMFWVSGVTHVKPVVGQVTTGLPAAAAGLRAGDELRSIDGEPVRDQGDVVIGLLDAMSSDGTAAIGVTGRDGRERTVQISVADSAEQLRLTEPAQLFRGLGFFFVSPPVPPVLGKVLEGGPAAAAGLQAGDVITAINGSPIRDFNELADFINARPGESVVVAGQRGEQAFQQRVVIGSVTDNGRTIGRIQVAPVSGVRAEYPPEMTTHSPLGPLEALGESADKAWLLTVTQAKFFVRMLTGQVSIKNLSGAISIAGYAGDSARAGAETFLMFLVLISLSLGFLNLLPIPILDGGQIVFQLAEWAKGSPLSERTYLVGQQAGLFLLVLLMGVALFNDLSGIFAAHP